MQINIQARHLKQAKKIKAYVKRRLGFSLSNRSDNIQAIHVTLSDINGPKGGVDKCCQIHLKVASIPDIIISKVGADIFSVIDKVSDRVLRSLNNKLIKKRSFKRSRSNENDSFSSHFLIETNNLALE